MADRMLIALPMCLAVFFVFVAATVLFLRAKARRNPSGGDAARTLLRDAAGFSAGAALLALFFIFNAVSFYLMG